jgi:hypothetical protein
MGKSFAMRDAQDIADVAVGAVYTEFNLTAQPFLIEFTDDPGDSFALRHIVGKVCISVSGLQDVQTRGRPPVHVLGDTLV